MASTFQDTRAAIRATPAWLGHAAQTLIGSRFFVAVSGIFFIAFLAHVTFAPNRFPPITSVNLLRITGFAPDLGPAPQLPSQVSAQVGNATQAGLPYVQDFIAKFMAGHPEATLYGNYIGLGVSALFLLLGLYLLARQESRRY